MKKYFFGSTIAEFLNTPENSIRGTLSENSSFSDELTQKHTWAEEIKLLKSILNGYNGKIFFEYTIPRMGRRIDVVLVISHVIFVLEFKVGETEYLGYNIDQAVDYALDLKNFHSSSFQKTIAPILVATEAQDVNSIIHYTGHNDNVLAPIRTNSKQLKSVIDKVLEFAPKESMVEENWDEGKYSPTPTIIEAAMALYNGHDVKEISRSDAAAINLTETSEALSKIIADCRINREKAICFVTGVPGAGKTLVGLNIATQHFDKKDGLSSVFLSGNGPLVAILHEALARDRVRREKELGNKVKKGEILSQVKVFVQNVHHYRDACLRDPNDPPFDHIAIFDEAQRAWNFDQTVKFMKQKKGVHDFSISEPEFLISCLDRHEDWAVIICLVGGGQEINTGEAGISEWIESLNRSFPEWRVYVSDRLTDSEYAAGKALTLLEQHKYVETNEKLHLSVSLRSFRAENLSFLVKSLLDLDVSAAQESYEALKEKYPIMLTRDIGRAKEWIRKIARGTERYGIVVSSQAERLKPHCIDVKSPMDPIHWFLDGKEDVRSSYYLEQVATEFHIQGLELDWTCVAWDADFRYTKEGWRHFSFVGDKWNKINKVERQLYLKNAYRVLLTRARQGMIILVPEGNPIDHTRPSEYYDSTFEYLKQIGFNVLN